MLPIKRTDLERFDVPKGDYETVIMLVEVPPQVNTGLHTHPGFDAAYLIEGDLTVLVQVSRVSRSSPANLGAWLRA